MATDRGVSMRYVSLFSGIEAASVAFAPLGWEAVAFAEIEPFPCAVLANRFPDVPNLGDVTKIDWKEFVDEHGAIDLVCGGSPCQSFSTAGGRDSLDGESRLCWEYVRAVRDIRPAWFMWENVPGVLSTRDNAFGQFIAALSELGYHDLAYRTLDAQFFGVAQRRRRVFVVGHLGDGCCSAAVLFDRESVRGNTESSREKRAELAAAAGRRPARSYTLKLRHTGSSNGGRGGEGALIQDDVSATLACNQDQTVFAIQGDGSTSNSQNGRGYASDGASPTLNCTDRHSVAYCMADDNANSAVDIELSGTLKAGGGTPLIASARCAPEIGRGQVPSMSMKARW